MYDFCSNNALYSTSLSFRMFIFLLTPLIFKLSLSRIKSQPGVAYKCCQGRQNGFENGGGTEF